MACQTMSHQTQPPELETAFSCNIYHSQLLRLNNNIDFLVAFIKVIFRQADHQIKKPMFLKICHVCHKNCCQICQYLHSSKWSPAKQAQRTDVVFVKFCPYLFSSKWSSGKQAKWAPDSPLPSKSPLQVSLYYLNYLQASLCFSFSLICELPSPVTHPPSMSIVV